MPANETPSIPQGQPVAEWLELADSLRPVLEEREQTPLNCVRIEASNAHPMGWDVLQDIDIASSEIRDLRAGDSMVVDFGGHRTGYLSFALRAVGREPDAPVRLRLIFGEVPYDVGEPLHPYTGWISASWLPEEIVTIDDLPQEVRLPRRYAFRFVRIEVISTSREFGVNVHNIRAHAVTSARGSIPSLPSNTPAVLQRIDEVSIATLRDCMQTCFEDGPRRDRRLWVGDLRLQALVHYSTFGAGGGHDVVRRCLYLFAGLPRADGLVNACVYERPRPTYASIVTLDYAALWVVTLSEYLAASGDLATARELWPVAKAQIEILRKNVDVEGRFVDPQDSWIFIDWAEGLDKTVAMHGVLMLALRHGLRLADAVGTRGEVADWGTLVQAMATAALGHFWDERLGLFVSGPNRQVSCASQAWMALAGVALPSEQLGCAIKRALADAQAVRPVTPYLYHYLVEGLAACSLNDEARQLIESYWGRMVALGADTFWEAFDPANPLSSPYGDVHANSWCHAWSCTPSWFFRQPGFLNFLPNA